MRFDGEWKDIGTWNTFTEAMEEPVVGNGMIDNTCENVHVINELSVPILAVGLKDAVVTASPEGILVSDKEKSSRIKPYVDKIHQQTMFAEKSWGLYRVLNIEENSLTVKITLNPGQKMNYHSHERRSEVWVIIAGKGKTLLDGKMQDVAAGSVISIPVGCRHTIIAESMLHLIEIQTGKEISVTDKIKFSFPKS